jgi:ribonuclease P protein component
VGFVVSKAVGNSVVRHRVARRLRHLMRDRLGTLPAGCSLVVRALPAAAASTSAELGTDLDGALRRLGRGGSGGSSGRGAVSRDGRAAKDGGVKGALPDGELPEGGATGGGQQHGVGHVAKDAVGKDAMV